MDRIREQEAMSFKSEVEERVEELEGYLRGFREELVKNDGLSRVFGTIRQTENVEDLPIEYRKVIEWARISCVRVLFVTISAQKTFADSLIGRLQSRLNDLSTLLGIRQLVISFRTTQENARSHALFHVTRDPQDLEPSRHGSICPRPVLGETFREYEFVTENVFEWVERRSEGDSGGCRNGWEEDWG